MSGAIRSDRRLYLVEDKSRVVEAGDPDARWLLCPAGGEVSRSDAERFGLLTPPEPTADPAEELVEEKAASAPANKARGRATNK